MQNKQSKKERFYKVYSNLPLNLREEIILVIKKNEPISWKIAKMEIDNNTKLSKTILDKLEALNFI